MRLHVSCVFVMYRVHVCGVFVRCACIVALCHASACILCLCHACIVRLCHQLGAHSCTNSIQSLVRVANVQGRASLGHVQGTFSISEFSPLDMDNLSARALLHGLYCKGSKELALKGRDKDDALSVRT